jgi:hypothetical protein
VENTARSGDELLRSTGAFRPDAETLPVRAALTLFAAGACLYGAALGSYETRALQALCSAAKMPLLLGLSALICLPSFAVIGTVLGLRADLGRACRGLLAAQATVALALASFAPLTVLLYASGCSYRAAIVGNGALAGQVTLRRHFRPLELRNPRHRVARRVWLALYIFVAIQLAWVLRPFVGSPGVPTRFLREDAWDNAYVIVAQTIAELLTNPPRPQS